MGKTDIKDFMDYCGINATATTLYKIENKLIQIDSYFKGNLNSLTLKDIHSFLSYLNKQGYAKSTKNDFIKILKRFLKWKYKDWNIRFNELKDAKAISNDQRKLSKQDLLTPDERRIIITSTDSLKYKTLLLLLEETASRPEEILKITWKDINLDRKEIKLHSSKTDKTRTIPIDKSIEHLKRYKEECFFEPPRINDRVFKLTNRSFHNFLSNTEKKLKFKKHLFPYLWRHSILSHMIKKLSPKVYEMYSGHSLKTGMKIYAHLDNEDLREELNEKIYKIEKITEQEREEIKKLKQELREYSKDLASSQVYNSIFAEFFMGRITKKELEEQIKYHQEATDLIKGKIKYIGLKPTT